MSALTLAVFVLQYMPVPIAVAQEELLESDSFNFREATPTVAAASTGVGQGNAMKVREAPVSATGAYETSVPIDVPPGRSGMTPSLALRYSSDAARADSPVGAGFSLSLPAMARSTSGGFPPLVGQGDQRRYANDVRDNPLVAGRVLFTSPSGDLVPAEAVAAPPGVGALFVPQREERPVRYEFIEAADRWVEHLPDGRKRFYGASSTGASPARVVNELGTHRWLLVEELDADGNQITYFYHHIAEQFRADRFAAQSVPVLRQIRWGGNTTAGIGPLFRVETAIDDYDDGPLDMLNGHVVLTSKLTSLSVFGPAPGGGAETLYWRYDLDSTASADTGRQLLRSVSRVPAGAGEPLVWRFEYSENGGRIEFEAEEPVPNFPPDVYVDRTLGGGFANQARVFAANAGLTPLDRPQGFQFLDYDADGDTDILYHPAGLKTPAATLEGPASFDSVAAGDGRFPEYSRFGADFGYAPDLFVKSLADVDGDRDLDAVSFRMTVQHNRFGDGEVISRTLFNETEDVTAGLMCTPRGAQDGRDVGTAGLGGVNVGRVACPDPLPPDIQIGARGFPFPFPEIFPDLGLDPVNPFIDIINPPDPLGPGVLLDFSRRTVSVGEADLILSTSYPSGTFFRANGVDVTRLIEAEARGPLLPAVTLTLPAQLSSDRLLLAATGSLRINDRVTLLGSGGNLACVANLGNAETNFGVSTRVGEVWTQAPLTLRGSIVDGALRATAGIQQQLGTVLNGPVDTSAFANATTSLEFAFRAPQGNVEVRNDTSQSLAPGSYNNLVVRARAELHLETGQYDFDELLVEPQARVIFHQQSGPTALYARAGFTFRGAFEGEAGATPDVLVVYAGSRDVNVEAAFTGTLLAPGAKLNLATVQNAEHLGSFFARDIEAHQDSVIRHRAFPFDRLQNPRALPVDFRLDGIEQLVQRAPALSGPGALRLIDFDLDAGTLAAASRRLAEAQSNNPIRSFPIDFGDTLLLTPRNGLVADVLREPEELAEDLARAKSFLCESLCNGGDGFFACVDSLGGLGNSWLQSDASVSQFGELPTLSDPALLGTVGHFVGSPVDLGIDFGQVGTGNLPDLCSAAPISMACVGMMLLCDDPTKCDDVSAGVPATAANIIISEFSKERVEQNPGGDPALSSVFKGEAVVIGWPRVVRQIVSLRAECNGLDVALRAEPESDFQAPFVDVDADGRADIVLLKSMKRIGDEFTFASFGNTFINRLKERREFIQDTTDTGGGSAFSESLQDLIAPNAADLLPCIPGHTSFSGNNEECDQALTFPLGLDFLTMPADLNADGLTDMILARPPGDGLPIATKPCFPGNIFHLNRGYAWESREDAFSERTLPGLYPGELEAGGPSPLELLRNRSRSCGLTDNLLEVSLGDEIPPEAMRLGDLNADGRVDIVFAQRLTDGSARRAAFLNTGRSFRFRELPAGIGDFALTSEAAFGPVLAGDTQRLVDLDNDGLTDILNVAICTAAGCPTPTWRRNAGVVPDLLTSVTENTGAATSLEYVAATSADAQSSGVIVRGGQLPAGLQVVRRLRRAAGPTDGSWAGVGPIALEQIELSYENFVRELGSSKALGFERVSALFANALPGGVLRETLQTTRVFDVRDVVPLTGGGDAPVRHALRGRLRETISTSGSTRLRQARDYFLRELAPGAVTVRPSLEARELCEGAACVTTGRVMSEFDELGFPARLEAGNFAGAAIVADIDRTELVRAYQQRQDLWKLGLTTNEDLFGYTETTAGTPAFDALLTSQQSTYDELGRPELVMRELTSAGDGCDAFPSVATRLLSYTSFGLPETITEHGIRTTTTDYDATGLYPELQSVGVVSAGGTPGATLSESFEFDLRYGVLTRRTDHNGQTFSTELDDRARPTRVAGPGDVTLETYSYRDATATSPNLMLATIVTDPGLSYTVQSFHDGAKNRLAQVELAPGRAQPFVRRQHARFDAFGRRVENFQPAPAASLDDIAVEPGEVPDRFEFDGFDRLKLARQAGREPLIVSYDVSPQRPGSVVRRTNPRGTTTSAFLNARGKVAALVVASAAGASLGTTELVRDGADRIVRVADADGLERNLRYDLGGRVVEATLPHTGSPTIAAAACHDADDQLVLRTTATGREMRVERDNLARQTRIEHRFEGELRTHTFAYDSAAGLGLGRLVLTSDDSGTYRYAYDEFGRVSRTEYTLSPTLAAGLPAALFSIDDDFTLRGQLDRRETNGLGVAPAVIDLGLDVKGAVTSVLALDAAFPTGRSLLDSVTYDAFERPAQMRLGNGVDVQRSYEPITQRPSAILHSDGEIFAELSYPAYDANDNLLREERFAEGELILTKSHGYDELDRLIQSNVDFGAGADGQSYAFSLAGNIQSGPDGTYAYGRADNGHAATSITGAGLERSLAYDADGQLTSDVTTDSRDADVEVLSRELTSDAAGCIERVEAQRSIDAAVTASVTTRHVCNAAGERVARDTTDDLGARRERVIFLPGGLELRPDDEAGALLLQKINISELVLAEVAWSLDSGEPIAEKSGYLHTDLRGSVLAKTGLDDPARTFLERADYTAFGETVPFDAEAAPERQFTGVEPDPVTGDYRFGLRTYDPRLARFFSPDPAAWLDPGAFEQDPQQLNLYSYARNNPVTAKDADGDIVETLWDVANIAMGVASLVDNIQQGNVGMAIVDAAGIVVDTAATVIPGVPGGAGAGLKAARGGAHVVEGALDTVRAGDKIVDAAKAGRAAEAGQAGGRAAEGAAKATPRRGIYEFPDQTAGGKPYVGQSGNIPERLSQHEAAGRLTPGTETTKSVEGNKTAREVAEHKRIQELTGGVPARKSPDVANKVDPIGPARKHLLE